MCLLGRVRRWAEESADQNLTPTMSGQGGVKTAGLAIDLGKLILEQLVSWIEREHFDPAITDRVALDMRRDTRQRRQIKGQCLAAAGARAGIYPQECTGDCTLLAFKSPHK